MLHSKWAEGYPQTSNACNSLRINGSSGVWYSVHCSDKHPVVCMTSNGDFKINKEHTSATLPDIHVGIDTTSSNATSDPFISTTTGFLIHDIRTGNHFNNNKNNNNNNNNNNSNLFITSSWEKVQHHSIT